MPVMKAERRLLLRFHCPRLFPDTAGVGTQQAGA